MYLFDLIEVIENSLSKNRKIYDTNNMLNKYDYLILVLKNRQLDLYSKTLYTQNYRKIFQIHSIKYIRTTNSIYILIFICDFNPLG